MDNKNSYIDDTDFNKFSQNKSLKVMHLDYPFDEDYDIYGSGLEPEGLKMLDDASDTIIKAKLVQGETRSIYYGCVLSKLVVLDVYKGNLAKNQVINIFEPVECTQFSDVIVLSEGYSPMIEGEEYLIYLRTLDGALYSDSKFVYIPSTILYSKFRIKNEDIPLYTEQDLDGSYKSLYYNEIKDADLYAYNEDEYQRYTKLKKEVIDKYL
ncbi:MAG: hypothetical protein LBN22_07215 [Clostridiales Family XIII bacterium]|jgi:hypothetical protein|nr:hypothetical protein [Clostridiales Family XIII bacterium]